MKAITFLSAFAIYAAMTLGLPASSFAHGWSGGGGWGGYHGGGGWGWGGYRGGGWGCCGYRGGGWGWGGVSVGIGVGPYVPYYVPPPVYYAPAPFYYPPPPVYYAPPPPGYYSPYPGYIARLPAPTAAPGQPLNQPASNTTALSCNAGNYTCPMEATVPVGGRCYCRANDGSRAYGTAQ